MIILSVIFIIGMGIITPLQLNKGTNLLIGWENYGLVACFMFLIYFQVQAFPCMIHGFGFGVMEFLRNISKEVFFFFF